MAAVKSPRSRDDPDRDALLLVPDMAATTTDVAIKRSRRDERRVERILRSLRARAAVPGEADTDSRVHPVDAHRDAVEPSDDPL